MVCGETIRGDVLWWRHIGYYDVRGFEVSPSPRDSDDNKPSIDVVALTESFRSCSTIQCKLSVIFNILYYGLFYRDSIVPPLFRLIDDNELGNVLDIGFDLNDYHIIYLPQSFILGFLYSRSPSMKTSCKNIVLNRLIETVRTTLYHDIYTSNHPKTKFGAYIPPEVIEEVPVLVRELVTRYRDEFVFEQARRRLIGTNASYEWLGILAGDWYLEYFDESRIIVSPENEPSIMITFRRKIAGD